MKRGLLISAAIAIAIFPAHSMAAGLEPGTAAHVRRDDPELGSRPGPHGNGEWQEPPEPPTDEAPPPGSSAAGRWTRRAGRNRLPDAVGQAA